MKKNNFTTTGRTNDKGILHIPSKPEMDYFLGQNPNKGIMVTLTVYDTGSSEALRGYFYKKVLPDFQEAYREIGERYTLKETEEKLLWLCPITRLDGVDETSGEHYSVLKPVSELNNGELVFFIEHLKQIAAEEFSIYIDDPRTL